MFLFFSHSLTEEQREDAIKNWRIEEFVPLPNELQHLFSNIPADVPELTDIIKPFKKFLKENASENDLLLIQGDFGVVYHLVNYAKKLKVVPVYATTERISVEQQQPDGSVVMNKTFRHRRFRKF